MFASVVLFLTLASSAYAAVSYPTNFEEAQVVISNHLHKYYPKASQNLCVANNCCNITSTENCSISKFTKDKSTLVLPGGSTRCIFSDSSPFAFQVIPGDSDKLLFYFQGGGACWNKASTSADFCTTDAVPQSLIGAFDRTNTKNRFKSYTIVHVLYCSGDVHGGNVTRSYTDSKDQPVVQVGLKNTQSVLDWVKNQVKLGGFPSSFSELVVMGCSAGSLGAQLWGQEILTQLSWKHAAIVPDSYAGVFPEGSVGPLFYDYGFCTCGFLSDPLYKKCINQQLNLEEMNLDFMNDRSSVPYNFIQSKTDAVQISFWISVAATTNSTKKTITPTEFYNQVNNLFGDYNNLRQNFLTYLIDGDHHCFTPYTLYYDADTKGPNDAGATTSTTLLYDWTNNYPLSEGVSAQTKCDGTVTANRLSTTADNTYCSSKVVPKTFTEHY